MADLNIGNSSASVIVNAKHNGSVIPQINNTYDLGTSALKWKNIYGGTFVGSLNGNAATATNADKLDNKHANEFIHFSYDTGLGNGSPADIAKSYFVNDDKTPKGMLKGYYNHNGVEYSQLYSRSSSGSYGSILRWGYNNKYMYILRYRNGWQSEDWEKMDAGNADTATKATQDGDGNVITSYYLPKTTYEYNKELALGSSGKVCIGKFPCYDSNISVEIKSTTNTTYNGTLIIATQNINTSLGGVYKAVVYGDENNTLTNSIKIEYLSGSNVFSIYINLPPWSKNILHIQCVSLAGAPTNIATTVDSIPSTATIVPTNAFIHTHSYAGSSSAGGSATSAVKLDSSAGSTTQPVYFSNGKPVATTYTLGASVPSNAKFTDTTYSAATTSAAGLMSKDDKAKLDGITASADAVSFSRSLTSGTKVGTITINGTGTDLYAPPNIDTHWTTGITAGATGTTSNSATTNGNTFIIIKDNSTHRGQIKLVCSGATSVSSDANGVITINSTDNNTTYGSMSVSEGTTGTATTDRVLTATNLKGIINANISNIQIGGRNLLKQYIKAGGRCTKIDNLTIKVGTESSDTYFFLKPHCNLIAGETYTISCEASNVPSGCNWSFAIRNQNSNWQLYINKNGKNFATGVLDADIGADTEFILDDLNGRPSTAPNIILTNFKLEKGNKATDWTPAPEDVENYTDNVVSDAKTEITREYSSLINEIASQISLTVDELSRTVNANSDSIVHINNSINVTSQDINLVKTTMSNIQNAVNGKVSADEIKEWARFDGATLELGASNQPFKARLTTTELAFYQGSNKVAWISNNEFHILTAIITQSISCGNFTFVDEGSMGFSLL